MTLWIEIAKDIERYTGKPYLYYKLRRKKNIIAEMNQNTMNTILESQQNLFYSRFNKLNNTNFLKKDIDDLLNDWTTNGIVGQKLASQMNRIASFASSGSYGTSAGLNLNNGNTLSVEVAAMTTKKTAKEVLDSCSSVIEAVDRYIAETIKLLASNNENIIAEEILIAYRAGGGGTVVPLPNINGKKLSRSMIKSADTNVEKLIERLNEIMEKIRNLGNGPGQTAPDASLYKGYLGSLEGVFNSLGGTINELVIAHGINIAAGIGNGAIKKSEKQIEAMVKRAGGRFYSQWDAQDIAEGRQTKNDVTVYYNKNGVTVSLGGSIKLRQGEKFQGSSMKTIEGLVARNESYRTIAEKMEAYIPGITQYGYEMIGAFENNGSISDFNGDWWKMKQFAGALTLVDALSGLGVEKGDFSNLFIVNNKIFSMADILEKIAQRSGDFGKSRNRVFNVDFDYSSVQKEIATKSKQNNNKTSIYRKAALRNKYAYEILAKEKIQISINLGELYKNAF